MEWTFIGDDELYAWVKSLPKPFFLPPQQFNIDALQKLSGWVTGGKYEQTAVTQFLQLADYYICAQALAGSHTVVTLEVPSDSRKKVKIADVWIAMSIPYLNTFYFVGKGYDSYWCDFYSLPQK